MLNFHRV
ncbi:hypothetical protein D030_2412A, partial [Vibrio parahaemolyticus AQ3810]